MQSQKKLQFNSLNAVVDLSVKHEMFVWFNETKRQNLWFYFVLICRESENKDL